MAVRIAIASDDGIHVNQHFGWAEELLVYELSEDGSSCLIDERPVPEIEQDGEKGRINQAFEATGCGCGNGHSCSENFKHTNVDRLLESVRDCKYILALKVGRMMEKLFRAEGISAFSVDLSIEEALSSISAYEKRMHRPPVAEN